MALKARTLLMLTDVGSYREGGWIYTVTYGVWPQTLATSLAWLAFAELALAARAQPVPPDSRPVPPDSPASPVLPDSPTAAASRRHLVRAALATAGALLAHPMALMMLALGAPLYLLTLGLRGAPDRRTSLATTTLHLGLALSIGAALAAWWLLPMGEHRAWMANYGWLHAPLADMLRQGGVDAHFRRLRHTLAQRQQARQAPLRAHLAAMRARIVDRWEALETGKAVPAMVAQPYSAAVEAIQVALVSAQMSADILRIEGSARLGMVRQAHELAGAGHLLPMLPVYAIDAPNGSSSDIGSEPTASLSALLVEHGCRLTAVAANKRLESLGYLKQMQRPSSRGGSKKYWSVTKTGSKYGKNATSDRNQRETQPVWYKATAAAMIQEIKSA